MGRIRMYYGWSVLLVAAAAMVGTLPGRTQGLGLVTEPLLADLALDRVTYAQLNFWATIIGAAGAIGMGHALDRLGSRIVLVIVSVALGIVVVAMSGVTGVVSLAICLTLTRALGQSALSVVSIAAVGQWFVRRIDLAMAIYTVIMSVGFMIAFPLVGSAVQRYGWRTAWFAIGVALLAGLAPLAFAIVRRSPESIGLAPDGDDRAAALATPVARDGELPGHPWHVAMLTPAFWVFAIGTSLYGLVASGIGLFNESILAERGFGPQVYYQALVMTAMTGLVGNFVGGWLARQIRLTVLLAASLGVLALGLAVLPYLSAFWQVMAWAEAMGLGGGLVTVLFFSVWPRAFGRRDLGRIQGAAQALTVLASALGPLLLAWTVEATGSYSIMFTALAILVGANGAAALVISMPEGDMPSTVTAATQ